MGGCDGGDCDGGSGGHFLLHVERKENVLLCFCLR